MKSTVRSPRRAVQRGAALIEALVAALIFSFGILGMVGLQANMTRAQTEAKFRADATALANELLAYIQTDRANFNSYTTAPAAPCAYARCLDWRNKVSTALPAGEAVTAVDSVAGGVTVTLTWSAGQTTRTHAIVGAVH